jgi:hypothetical protein
MIGTRRMVRARDFREWCRAAYLGLSLPILVILEIVDPATGWRSPRWLVSVLSLAGNECSLGGQDPQAARPTRGRGGAW